MFGKRLKRLREQTNMLQDEVAEAIGTTARNIGYYENEDRRPNPEMLVKLADFYNVTVDYILGRSDNPHSNFITSNVETKQEKQTLVKVLGDIRAGRPLFSLEHIKGEVKLPQKVLTNGYEHFMLEVVGDSMTGDNINQGDLVLIRVQDHIDFEGQIAAVIVNDEEACLKRVYLSNDKKYVILRSSNPKYQDIVRQTNEVTINGVLAGYFKQA